MKNLNQTQNHTESSYSIISFYRYININHPEQLQQQLTTFCTEHHLLGRILLATEGINGAICGQTTEIKLFQTFLQNNPTFQNITFREQSSPINTYHKLVIKIRKEIVAFGTPVNPKNTADYLTPKQLNELYLQQDQQKNQKQKANKEEHSNLKDNHRQEFIVVDARNDYEFKVGRFKNAIPLKMHNFREFPNASKELEPHKDKKIILFCTGGIRCEKASAYLKEQGFPAVYHLKGGVIEYLNSDHHSNWEGGLFVFDDRLVSPSDTTLTNCTHCTKPSAQYYNCYNVSCDQLFICCTSCIKEHQSCCSTKCEIAPRKREDKQQLQTIAIVQNFYEKPQVAYIKTITTIKVGDEIIIQGKTTFKKTTITEIRNEQNAQLTQASENQNVTISIQTKARKNDKICRVLS